MTFNAYMECIDGDSREISWNAVLNFIWKKSFKFSVYLIITHDLFHFWSRRFSDLQNAHYVKVKQRLTWTIFESNRIMLYSYHPRQLSHTWTRMIPTNNTDKINHQAIATIQITTAVILIRLQRQPQCIIMHQTKLTEEAEQ